MCGTGRTSHSSFNKSRKIKQKSINQGQGNVTNFTEGNLYVNICQWVLAARATIILPWLMVCNSLEAHTITPEWKINDKGKEFPPLFHGNFLKNQLHWTNFPDRSTYFSFIKHIDITVYWPRWEKYSPVLILSLKPHTWERLLHIQNI